MWSNLLHSFNAEVTGVESLYSQQDLLVPQ